MPAMRDAAGSGQNTLFLPLPLPLHQGSYCHPHRQNPPCTAYTPMMDFPSWSQAAVLSPSQCPPQRPEEGNVERVMMIPLSPVTSCIALVGTQGGILKKGWGRRKLSLSSKTLCLKYGGKYYCILLGKLENGFQRVLLLIETIMTGIPFHAFHHLQKQNRKQKQRQQDFIM